MSRESKRQEPLARKKALVIEEVSDELLVYDLDRHKAHCLNRTAAWVWKHCDGQTPVEELAHQLGEELGTPVDEKLIWFALNSLSKDHLLEKRLAIPPMMAGLNRRQMIRAIGLGALVVMPMVTSIVAPTAEAATSCKGTGAACTFGTECCSGICTVNGTCQ